MYKRLKYKVTSLQTATRFFYKSMYEKGLQETICKDDKMRMDFWQNYLADLCTKKEISKDAFERWKDKEI